MRKLIKINSTGEIPVECFHSLKTFFDKYPQYEKHKEKIITDLTRKKQPCFLDGFILYRVKVE